MTREHCDKPCGACPWRKDSEPGELGGNDPASFVFITLMEVPVPCHQTIEYEEGWAERWQGNEEGKLCAGALAFLANVGRESSAKPSDAVFATADEFTDHHKGSG